MLRHMMDSPAEFKAHVERAYGRKIMRGEHWTLFGDALIIAHPDRPPIMVDLDGSVKEIQPCPPPA